MNELKPFLISLVIIAGLFFGLQANAQTIFRVERSLVPETDSTYYLGTTTPSLRAWLRVIADSFYDTDALDGCAEWSSNVLTSTGSACGAGGGGSGGGTFSTTTSQVSGQLINYPNNATDIVNIGSNSTTTGEYYFDPNLPLAKINNQFFGLSSTTLQNFTGVNATTTSATSTNLSTNKLTVTGTATTTFAGSIDLTSLTSHITAHGIRSDASDGLHVHANNWTEVANFGIGNTANSTFFGAVNVTGNLSVLTGSTFGVADLTSALTLTNGSGVFAEYAGTSCTNQFVRSLSALGVATCATVSASDVDLADLTATDTTLTFSGAYDGQTARTIGLNLANANTWTGGQIFANSTTTNATTTSLAILNLTQADCDLKALTTGVVYCGTDSTSAGGSANSKWATSTDTTSIYPNGATKVGIGTTTPQWLLQLTSASAPQLTLSNGALNHWSFRSTGNYLEIGTSSLTTFATSTPSAFRLAADYNGTTTINGLVESLGFTVDSGSASTAYTAGWKGFIEVPYDADIIGWTAIATTTDSTTVGTTTIDVYKDTYANFPPTSADSIFTSTKVGIYGGIKEQSTSTPATQRITAGDIISFFVDSNTNLKRITVILKVKRR
jgi:hypothetical protein